MKWKTTVDLQNYLYNLSIVGETLTHTCNVISTQILDNEYKYLNT